MTNAAPSAQHRPSLLAQRSSPESSPTANAAPTGQPRQSLNNALGLDDSQSVQLAQRNSALGLLPQPRQSMPAQPPSQRLSGFDKSDQQRQSVHANENPSGKSAAARLSVSGRPLASSNQTMVERRQSESGRHPAVDRHSAWHTFAHEMPAQPYSPRPGVQPPASFAFHTGERHLIPHNDGRQSMVLQDAAGQHQQPQRGSFVQEQAPPPQQPRLSLRQDMTNSAGPPTRDPSSQRLSIKSGSLEAGPMGMHSEVTSNASDPVRLSLRGRLSETNMQQQPSTSGQVVEEPMSPRPQHLSNQPLARPSTSLSSDPSTRGSSSLGRTTRDRSFAHAPQHGTNVPEAADLSLDQAPNAERVQHRSSGSGPPRDGFGSEITSASLQADDSVYRRNSALNASAAQAVGSRQLSPRSSFQQPLSHEPNPQQPTEYRSTSESAPPIARRPSSPRLLQHIQSRPSSGFIYQQNPAGRQSITTDSTKSRSGDNQPSYPDVHQSAPETASERRLSSLQAGYAPSSARPSLMPRATSMQEQSQLHDPAPSYRRSQSAQSDRHRDSHHAARPNLYEQMSDAHAGHGSHPSAKTAPFEQSSSRVQGEISRNPSRRGSHVPPPEAWRRNISDRSASFSGLVPQPQANAPHRYEDVNQRAVTGEPEAEAAGQLPQRLPWSRSSSRLDAMSDIAEVGSPRHGMSRMTTMQTELAYPDIPQDTSKYEDGMTEQLGIGAGPVHAETDGLAGLTAIQGMLDHLADQLR